MAEFQSWLKSSDRNFTAILQCKHLLFPCAWNAKKTICNESGCWQRNSRFYKLFSNLEHDLYHRTVRTLEITPHRIFSATCPR
jgi:hypothetical protein